MRGMQCIAILLGPSSLNKVFNTMFTKILVSLFDTVSLTVISLVLEKRLNGSF